jgi:predicted amidohydrolase
VGVVDVATRTVGLPTSVVVQDGIIAAIDERAPAAALTPMEGRGRFLVPGFWDMHAHSFQHSPQVDCALWVANGVTNLRDMMDCPGAQSAPQPLACTEHVLADELPRCSPAQIISSSAEATT